MDRFLDIASDIAKVFAAINILAATYYHYRYTVGPSSTKNFMNAEIHWILSGFFVIAAVVTDTSLSGTATLVIAVGALVAPVVPVIYLRRIRAQRAPTFLDEIAMDDIIDRAHSDRNQD
ncbi:MAG: hypothetical protein WBD41_28065 [Rhodococcus sp. (in: high G+C Gram-positive bacteria)]